MMEVRVYDSFAEVPLDPEPDFEGDDSISIDDRNQQRALYAHAELVKPTLYHLVVPYPGRLHEGDHGDQVYGVKRLVHRYTGTLAALRLSPPSARRRWGPLFTTLLKVTQHRLGVPRTAVWDRATHEALAQWADQYAIQLLHEPALSPQQKQTDKLIAALMAFYNRRYSIAYSQDRPTQLMPVKKLTRADCSGAVAWGMWTAGVFPQVDWRYTNTDTQIMFGAHLTGHDVIRPGDVAFYGHGNDPNHETCVVSVAGGEVRVFSDGHYPARILPIDYNRGRLGGRIAMRRFIT